MILLCMGYWDGDKSLAIEVVDQIAKLIPEKSELVSLCYVYRFDSSPPDEEILQRDREKFHRVYTAKCDYEGTGWPGGCNSISYSILNTILPKADKEIECGLILESDCVITRQNWDKELWQEWLETKKQKKDVCGAVIPWGYKGHPNHVNAAALWHRDVAKKIVRIDTGKPMGKIGWDFYYGRLTVPLARNSKLFRLDNKRETITAKELFSSEVLVYHGVKDNSARKAVERKFKL